LGLGHYLIRIYFSTKMIIDDVLRGVKAFFYIMSEASNLSGVVAHNLSGLGWLLLEVADETDRVATGDPSDAI